MRLILVGPGRVGMSVAADLVAAGRAERPVVLGRRSEPPPFLRRHLVGARYLAGTDGAEPGGVAAELADALGTPLSEATMLFAVPDDALPGVAAGWASGLGEAGLPAPAAALHTSGFHSSRVLAPLGERGASLASWHPLVALALPGVGAFRGRTVGVEGAEPAASLADSLAEAVGARPVRLRAAEKARWHAAAVFASNALVACLSVATREARAAAADEIGLEDLLPLARSALDAVADRGLPEGLTGPVARGDRRTVSGHLGALDPRAASLYRLLADELLLVADARLDPVSREALSAALEGPEAAERPGDEEAEG